MGNHRRRDRGGFLPKTNQDRPEVALMQAICWLLPLFFCFRATSGLTWFVSLTR